MLPIVLKYFGDLSPTDLHVKTVEKSIAEIQSTGTQVNKEVQQISKQNQEIANQISNLTSRINQLVSDKNQIQSQIEDMKVAVHKGLMLMSLNSLQINVDSLVLHRHL